MFIDRTSGTACISINHLLFQMFCKDNHHNELSAFWFQRAEDTLRSLFHDPKGKIFISLKSLVESFMYFPTLKEYIDLYKICKESIEISFCSNITRV